MFKDDDEFTKVSDTQYRLPAYEAMVTNPAAIAKPVIITLVIAFFGIRWLMKS